MKVILDVDGVLANFAEGASLLHNRPNPFLNPNNFGNYWMEKIWGMPQQEFIEHMDYEFWDTLPLMPDASLIVDLVIKAFGRPNICILTKPLDTIGCLEGKKSWLKRNFPMIMDNWLFGNNKNFCSHSNSLLIDDNEKHCREFQQAGGRAFLVPAPWNFKWMMADSPATSLEMYIQEIRKQGLIL